MLECYRKVCKRRLGQYSLNPPTFKIDKNKVKQVNAQTSVTKVGGSHQPSMLSSNNNSSSDLGNQRFSQNSPYGTANSVMLTEPNKPSHNTLPMRYRKNRGNGQQDHYGESDMMGGRSGADKYI